MEGVSVCPSIISTTVHHSHLLGVLLSTEGSAVSSVKLFGWAVLEKAASSNTGGRAIGPFWTGTFWTGTSLVSQTWKELCWPLRAKQKLWEMGSKYRDFCINSFNFCIFLKICAFTLACVLVFTVFFLISRANSLHVCVSFLVCVLSFGAKVRGGSSFSTNGAKAEGKINHVYLPLQSKRD